MSTTLVGAALVLAGITAQAGWLFVLAAGVLGAVAASFVLLPGLGAVEIERELPRRVRAGDDVPVVVRLTNRGRRSLPAMRILDSVEAFEPVILSAAELPAGTTAHAGTTRRAERRGIYVSGSVRLETSAPLGFARRFLTTDAPATVTVVPSWIELGPWSRIESLGAGGEEASPRPGHGGDYLGVRDYRPGDPVRAVHWRSAARAGRLIVTEHEEQARRQVLIALGGPDAGDPPESAFETLVQAAASVAKSALDGGHSLALACSAGELWDARFGECLETLAAAAPDDNPLRARLEGVLGGAGGGGTVVLLTTETERAHQDLQECARLAAARGYQTVAVLAEPGSWGPAPDPSRSNPRVPGARTVRVWRNADLKACLQA